MSSGQRLDNLDNNTNDTQDSAKDGHQNHLLGWCGEGWVVKPNFKSVGFMLSAVGNFE